MAITEAATPLQVSAVEELSRWAAPESVVVQVRDRACSARELVDRARSIVALCRAAGQLAIVNDRIDVALAAAADGVHLPGAGVPASVARRLVGEGKWLSRALHDPGELSSEELSALDAVVLSPVVLPRKERAALGYDVFGEWARRCRLGQERLQVYALGGVSSQSAEACLTAGASGVAVMGAITEAAEARALVAALGIER
jgi:thiamine-phosphate pyrophosphorylase